MSEPLQTLFGHPLTLCLEVPSGEVLVISEGAFNLTDHGTIEVNVDRVARVLADAEARAVPRPRPIV